MNELQYSKVNSENKKILDMKVANKTVELYLDGMSYKEAFTKAKELVKKIEIVDDNIN
ncbi:hypothetical protein ACQPUI_17625 [Clostridium butyricum]|uniref:hypothetical protein n=1 Tax=Clostridium butyricum TaxID=1492 RepID=UPI003D324BF1